MKIKVNIHVEYEVDPNVYHYLDPENVARAIQIIELHSLSTAVAEVMPFPPITVREDGTVIPDNQVLKVKLEQS